MKQFKYKETIVSVKEWIYEATSDEGGILIKYNGENIVVPKNELIEL